MFERKVYTTLFCDVIVTGDPDNTDVAPTVLMGTNDELLSKITSVGLFNHPEAVSLTVRRALGQAALVDYVGGLSAVPNMIGASMSAATACLLLAEVQGRLLEVLLSWKPFLSVDSTHTENADDSVDELFKRIRDDLLYPTLSRSGVDRNAGVLILCALAVHAERNARPYWKSIVSGFSDLLLSLFLVSSVQESSVSGSFAGLSSEAILSFMQEWIDASRQGGETQMPLFSPAIPLGCVAITMDACSQRLRDMGFVPKGTLEMWLMLSSTASRCSGARDVVIQKAEGRELTEAEVLWCNVLVPTNLIGDPASWNDHLTVSCFLDPVRTVQLFLEQYKGMDKIPDHVIAAAALYGDLSARYEFNARIKRGGLLRPEVVWSGPILRCLNTENWLAILGACTKGRVLTTLALMASNFPYDVDKRDKLIAGLTPECMRLAPREWGCGIRQLILEAKGESITKLMNLLRMLPAAEVSAASHKISLLSAVVAPRCSNRVILKHTTRGEA